MKRMYEKPMAYVEEFTVNEYVSACYSLYCMISGNGNKYTGDAFFSNNDKYRRWNKNSGLTYTPEYEEGGTLLHGKYCADGSSLDDVTNIYYEAHNKRAAVGTASIQIGNDAGNGKKYATWISTDTNPKASKYHHYGYAIEDSSRPNHS